VEWFQLLPGSALATNAIKIFVVITLVVLLTWVSSAELVVLISAPDLTAATTKWGLATTACLMNAVLQHVPLIRASNAPVALLFALIPMILSATG
jgi:hypothetical protein